MSRAPPEVHSPKVYTIAAGVSFVDALASGILGRWGGDPLGLAPITVLLPTRRACRSLSDGFLRAWGGRPMMLPRLLPLGDLDAEELELIGDEPAETSGAAADLPPATPKLRRQPGNWRSCSIRSRPKAWPSTAWRSWCRRTMPAIGRPP
jgi:hypothetical protein